MVSGASAPSVERGAMKILKDFEMDVGAQDRWPHVLSKVQHQVHHDGI